MNLKKHFLGKFTKGGFDTTDNLRQNSETFKLLIVKGTISIHIYELPNTIDLQRESDRVELYDAINLTFLANNGDVIGRVEESDGDVIVTLERGVRYSSLQGVGELIVKDHEGDVICSCAYKQNSSDEIIGLEFNSREEAVKSQKDYFNLPSDAFDEVNTFRIVLRADDCEEKDYVCQS